MDDSKEILTAPLPEIQPNLFPMYKMKGRSPVFTDEVRQAHRSVKTPLWRYVRGARLLAVLSAPIIYLCLIPFLLLDLFLSFYQAVCFPVYGIPKVRRADYLIFDRGGLLYLNVLERFNCTYCSYANGLIAYVTEIVGRTEQHWCPIKHAHRCASQHGRYNHFLPYGNAGAYRERLDDVRDAFEDVNP
jgi:hypothetical protein